jgi:hypothetical protein
MKGNYLPEEESGCEARSGDSILVMSWRLATDNGVREYN